MFKNVVPLSPATDASLGLAQAPDWSFARTLVVVPVGAQEAQALSKDYVIVFAPGAPVRPVALLGAAGSNAYVDALGRWQASVIPAQARLYPFVLSPGQDPGGFIVARDADAPHFVNAGGQPLFTRDGEPSDLLQRVSGALMAQHQDYQLAETLARQLLDAGLIADRRLQVSATDGVEKSFTGFRAVDEEKLEALDRDAFLALMESGAMKLLEWHRLSLRNIGRLLA